jgi:hypothetical protein
VASWAFRGTRNVVAALFTGRGRLRGLRGEQESRPGGQGQPRPLRRGSCYRRWGGWVQARFGRGGWYLSGLVAQTRLPNLGLQPTRRPSAVSCGPWRWSAPSGAPCLVLRCPAVG